MRNWNFFHHSSLCGSQTLKRKSQQTSETRRLRLTSPTRHHHHSHTRVSIRKIVILHWNDVYPFKFQSNSALFAFFSVSISLFTLPESRSPLQRFSFDFFLLLCPSSCSVRCFLEQTIHHSVSELFVCYSSTLTFGLGEVGWKKSFYSAFE